MTVPPPPKPKRACEKCGAKVPAEAAWCPDCGSRLGAQAALADAEPPEEAEADPPASDPEVEARPAPFPDPPRTKTEPSSGPVSEAMESAAAPSEPEPSRLVPQGTIIDNKYEIARVLGQGGMGVVYLAQDVHTGVEVVLKAVRPELAHRKDVLSRTLAEGRTLARIDHPNVVHLNAVVADETGLWLVMQYIQGESLDQTVKRYREQGRTLSFTITLDIFRQVLQGVAAAHREGVIHRDLKPANVLVRQKDGVAKVTDFGIAKPEEQARVGQGNTKGVIGSLWYMSPEQVQGRRDLDKRLDIYALGIMLFELLTGRVPFHADSSYEIMRLHVEEPLPKVVGKRGDVPAWIDDVLGKACAKKREDRYSSCEEFLAALDGYMATASRSGAHGVQSKPASAGPAARAAGSEAGAITANRETVTDDDDPPPSRWWIVLVGLIAVATAVGAWAVWRYAIYEPPKKKPKPVAAAPAESAPAEEPTAPSGPTATGAAADPLAKLPGFWRSEAGTDFEALRIGDKVEFRVVNPKQLAPADYVKGEARFTLTRGPAETTFNVEEKMRPQASVPFDARSRTSCHEIWTEVDGKPLLATLSGDELAVDFAKISVSAGNLRVEGGKVVSCSKLRGTARGRGRSVLKRT
ncbi:MAG: protein kinase [Polyangiaceae bacterium]|nr:protein kinase [Polyangiaceae bacterium]MBK8941630.1 protein kinase [Polyangiaceae bacterium]